ncbi:hypothetical protein [Flavobacterium sangjuense]|uniref:Hydrolase n=1 Tax=Flavobacterium sangjuense TaxID=2518177 RepID=A0A4P7PTS3_9FLAO|nr:hypothetical protein [Flavobacterium sangjuense]QBZ98289.1 hypothetical protein GS03_01794 [Flavobacterium sangjuense]
MRKSLFLYLFIIAVLMNIFTYKYFTSKAEDEQKAKSEVSDTASVKPTEGTITNDPDVFSLENNDRAQNYLYESYKVNDVPAFAEKVKQALLTYNDSPEGNKYTDQPKMGEQKFIINSMKLINHRWIVANYSNGQLWGEVLLKYFVEENGSISFEVMNSYLYPTNLN